MYPINYRNKKNGKVYYMTDELVFNATNGRENEVLISYHDEEHRNSGK